MKRNGFIFLIILLVVLCGFWFVLKDRTKTNLTLLNTTQYLCDGSKFITAAYYEGQKTESKPGEPPIPSGRVEVSLDGAASTTLVQTISASGIRYANTDESFVFWSKGKEALIMRNNAMDLSYTNCIAD